MNGPTPATALNATPTAVKVTARSFGSFYLTVGHSDGGLKVYPLKVNYNPQTGAIQSAQFLNSGKELQSLNSNNPTELTFEPGVEVLLTGEYVKRNDGIGIKRVSHMTGWNSAIAASYSEENFSMMILTACLKEKPKDVISTGNDPIGFSLNHIADNFNSTQISSGPVMVASVDHANGSITIYRDYLIERGIDVGFKDFTNEPGLIYGVSWGEPTSAEVIEDIGYEAQTVSAAYSRNIVTVAFKTKPLDTQKIVQMPATGAPEGLSTIGLLASAVAVLGLVSVLLFRKRV